MAEDWRREWQAVCAEAQVILAEKAGLRVLLERILTDAGNRPHCPMCSAEAGEIHDLECSIDIAREVLSKNG